MKEAFSDYANEYGKQVVVIPISGEFEFANYQKNIGEATNVRFLSWPSSSHGLFTFKALSNVKYLDMKGIGLQVLPPEIGLCTNLERLDIRDNCLVFLPPELSRCLKLKNLLYEGNSIFYSSPVQALNQLRQLYQSEGLAPDFRFSQSSGFFTILSWNIISQSQACQKFFPQCPDKYLDWNYRMEHILHVLIQLKPSLVCLQDLEESQLNVLSERMRTIGYGCAASFASRPRVSGFPPTGVATFFLKSRLTVERTVALSFSELQGDENISKLQLISNEAVFQVSVVRLLSQSFYLINTSLRPNRFEKSVITAQMNIIANRVDELSGQVLICGSLGFEPDSDAYSLLKNGEACNGKFNLKRKYRSSYEESQDFFTHWDENKFSVNDYIWSSSQLVPTGLLMITRKSEVLSYHHTAPNNQWPSNHLPIGASIDIRLQNPE